MAVRALTSSLRVFRFDPVKSMQENLRTDTHPQSQKKAGLGKAAHEEFGRGGTRLSRVHKAAASTQLLP